MPGLDDTDPTDFEGIEGIGPVILPGQQRPLKEPRTNAATGASAAGVRAFTAQAVAFYFRAPVKAFFRTRVDYLVSLPTKLRSMILTIAGVRPITQSTCTVW